MKLPMIEVNKISFQYYGREEKALDDITFSIDKGEWIAIVGHNGSGKSTLAKLLIGLNLPSSGEIKVNSLLLNENNIWEIRRQIGMVFQNPDNQFVGTTVQDDVAFGLENAGIPRDEMIKRVQYSLEKVKMKDFLNQEPHHLSGGQKQRVAIAGVLALQPQVIIFDEATSMLDPLGKQEVLETVRQLKQEKQITIISITHDLEEAATADRMIVLNRGKLFAEGTPMEIFKNEKELKETGLVPPFSIKMSAMLRSNGLDIENEISAEGLVTQLCKLNLKM